MAKHKIHYTKSKTPFADAVEIANNKNISKKTVVSLNWFRQYTSRHLSHINNFNSLRSSDELVASRRLELGKIYTFMYNPKYKDSLPYYDVTPLIIPFKDEGKTFMGFNLHYLPYKHRAVIMDMLYKISNSTYTEQGKLNASYSLIQSMGKSELFKPCTKRYLKNRVGSSFLEFPEEYWEIGIFLPLATFRKGSISRVHQDSMESITRHHRPKKRRK